MAAKTDLDGSVPAYWWECPWCSYGPEGTYAEIYDKDGKPLGPELPIPALEPRPGHHQVVICPACSGKLEGYESEPEGHGASKTPSRVVFSDEAGWDG